MQGPGGIVEQFANSCALPGRLVLNARAADTEGAPARRMTSNGSMTGKAKGSPSAPALLWQEN